MMLHKNKLTVEKLRSQIVQLEKQLASLKMDLAKAESSQLSEFPANRIVTTPCNSDLAPYQSAASKSSSDWTWPLDIDEYKRYGRQMIMPEIGLKGWMSKPSLTKTQAERFHTHRPAQTEERLRPSSWSRRTGMPSCDLPCWSRHRDIGPHGRRCN